MLRVLTALALFAAAAACGGPQEPPTPEGQKLFRNCQTCHSLQPGENRVGPSLAGVVGRAAGSAPGFNYSAAMKKSGLVWDEATLDRYLTNPHQVVPGTRMAFAGLPDEGQRKALIDYLKMSHTAADNKK
jgi:cytochrome c2